MAPCPRADDLKHRCTATGEGPVDEAATHEGATDDPATDEALTHEGSTDDPPTGEALTDEGPTDNPATDEALTAEPADVAAEAAAHMTDTTHTADMTATAKATHVATAEAATDMSPTTSEAAAAMPSKRHGIGRNGGSSECNTRCEHNG